MTALVERNLIIELVDNCVTQGARQGRACETIDLSVRTLQRWKRDINAHQQHEQDPQQSSQQIQSQSPSQTPSQAPPQANPQGLGDRRPSRIQTPANAFTHAERQHILDTVNSPQYAHLSPAQIVPILADSGQYIGSESTIYRLLHETAQLAHRRSERPAAKTRSKPRALSASAANELYSWDITYLPAAIRGKFYYLYLFLDLFSRKIVGWQVYETESSEQAAQVMIDICAREGISAGQVVLHSDNGSPMKGATMLATLQQLGVEPSFSRPAVSNDNPYSEAIFKTCKYRPNYPEVAFADLMAARVWVGQFVQWYNHEHRHSAISFVTPAQRHDGRDIALLEARKVVYRTAQARHPARWSKGIRNWDRVDVVHLNPNQKQGESTASNEIKKQA